MTNPQEAPDYVRNAHYRCLGCGHEWFVSLLPGRGAQACFRCGYVYVRWENHPLTIERRKP